MKTKFFAILTGFLLTVTASFATETTGVPPYIVKKLNQQFNNPVNIEWKITSIFYKATFLTNDMELEAFYAPNGNYLGVSREISKDQLPLNLVRGLEKIKDPISITELYEINSERGTEYYVAYSDGRKITTLKGSTDGWNSYIL